MLLHSRVPLLDEVRDITVSQNNRFVLVSYENKVSTVHVSITASSDRMTY